MDERVTGGRTTLEELEHFQEQIRRYKAQREAVDQEFERFIRSFTAPRQTAEPASWEHAAQAGVPPMEAHTPYPSAPEPAAPEPLAGVVSASQPSALQSATPQSAAPEPLTADPVAPPGRNEAPVSVPEAPARRQTGARTGVLIGGTLALLAGGALATWTLRSRTPESPATRTAAPVAPPPARPSAPEPPPAVVAGLESELTTTRTVWVRVIADGERVLERELPAGARVPLKAGKTIVIRTGDAGAIRLSVRGQDQGVLGGAGEVVTRTFNVPPPQPAR